MIAKVALGNSFINPSLCAFPVQMSENVPHSNDFHFLENLNFVSEPVHCGHPDRSIKFSFK